MKTITILGLVLIATVVALPAVLTLAAHAVNDNNDNNNLTCQGNPHDKNDDGNPHEPPLGSGDPHFCPPISPRK